MGIYNKSKEKFNAKDSYQKIDSVYTYLNTKTNLNNQVYQYFEPDTLETKFKENGIIINDNKDGFDNTTFELTSSDVMNIQYQPINVNLPFTTFALNTNENLSILATQLNYSINDITGWLQNPTSLKRNTFISFWVKRDTQNANGGNEGHSIGGIIYRYTDESTTSSTANPFLSLYITTSGKIGLRLTTPQPQNKDLPITLLKETNCFEVESSQTLDLDTWYYVTFSYEFINTLSNETRRDDWLNSAQIYINGIKDNASVEVFLKDTGVWFETQAEEDHWNSNDNFLVLGNNKLTYGQRAFDIDDVDGIPPDYEALYEGPGFNGGLSCFLIQTQSEYSVEEYCRMLYLAYIHGVSKVHSGIHNGTPRNELNDKELYTRFNISEENYTSWNPTISQYKEEYIGDGNKFNPAGNFIKSNENIIPYLNLNNSDSRISTFYSPAKSIFFPEDMDSISNGGFALLERKEPTKPELYYESDLNKDTSFNDNFYSKEFKSQLVFDLDLPIEQELVLESDDSSLSSKWPIFNSSNIGIYDPLVFKSTPFDYDLLTTIQLNFEVSNILFEDGVDSITVQDLNGVNYNLNIYQYYLGAIISAIYFTMYYNQQQGYCKIANTYISSYPFLENETIIWNNYLFNFFLDDGTGSKTWTNTNDVPFLDSYLQNLSQFDYIIQQSWGQNRGGEPRIREELSIRNVNSILRFFIDIPIVIPFTTTFQQRMNDKELIIEYIEGKLSDTIIDFAVYLHQTPMDLSSPSVNLSFKNWTYNSYTSQWSPDWLYKEGFDWKNRSTLFNNNNYFTHRTMAYYNFAQKKWDYVLANPYQVMQTNSNLIYSGDIGFGPSSGAQINTSSDIISQGKILGRPVDICGFPYAKRYEANEEQLLDLNTVIPDNFVLEGYSLEIPVKISLYKDSTGEVNYEDYYALSIKDGTDFKLNPLPRSETENNWNTNSSRFKNQIFTSFLLKQSFGEKNYSENPEDAELLTKINSFSTYKNSVYSFRESSYKTTIRDLITYGQTNIQDNISFNDRYEKLWQNMDPSSVDKYFINNINAALGREQNIFIDNNLEWYTGVEFFHKVDSKVKITPSNKGNGVIENSIYREALISPSGSFNNSQNTDDGLITTNFHLKYGGGTNPKNISDNRTGIAYSISDSNTIINYNTPSYHNFNLEELSGVEFENQINIPKDSFHETNYRLFKKDKLVLGVQAAVNRFMGSVIEHWDITTGNDPQNIDFKTIGKIQTTLLTGNGKLKLYGKYEQDEKLILPELAKTMKIGDQTVTDSYDLSQWEEYINSPTDLLLVSQPEITKGAFSNILHLDGVDLNMPLCDINYSLNGEISPFLIPDNSNITGSFVYEYPYDFDGNGSISSIEWSAGLSPCTSVVKYRTGLPLYLYNTASTYDKAIVPFPVNSTINFLKVNKTWFEGKGYSLQNRRFYYLNFIKDINNNIIDVDFEDVAGLDTSDLSSLTNLLYIYYVMGDGVDSLTLGNFYEDYEILVNEFYIPEKNINSFTWERDNTTNSWKQIFGRQAAEVFTEPNYQQFIEDYTIGWSMPNVSSGWNAANISNVKSEWPSSINGNGIRTDMFGEIVQPTFTVQLTDEYHSGYKKGFRDLNKEVLGKVSDDSALNLQSIKRFIKLYDSSKFYKDSLPIAIGTREQMSAADVNISDNQNLIFTNQYDQDHIPYLNELISGQELVVDYDKNTNTVNNTWGDVVDINISSDLTYINSEILKVTTKREIQFPSFIDSNLALYQIFYGIGPGVNGKHLINIHEEDWEIIYNLNYNLAKYRLVLEPITGFRFGRSHLLPSNPSHIFSRTHFGHFADLIYQSYDSKIHNSDDWVVNIVYLKENGDIDPETTSNMSNFDANGRKTVPYHDMVENDGIVSNDTVEIDFNQSEPIVKRGTNPFGKSESKFSTTQRKIGDKKLAVNMVNTMKKSAIATKGNTRKVLFNPPSKK